MATPVVLELASLPREQVGPFLLLGLPKDADKELIESNWADRLKWARKQGIKVPLEDINWARDVLSEVEKRIKADAASLNADTTDGILKKLALRYGGSRGRMWQPLDSEKPLADYTPPAEVPSLESVRAALVVSAMPEEYPAVPRLLERLASLPLDPWTLELPCKGGVASPQPTSPERQRRDQPQQDIAP